MTFYTPPLPHYHFSNSSSPTLIQTPSPLPSGPSQLLPLHGLEYPESSDNLQRPGDSSLFQSGYSNSNSYINMLQNQLTQLQLELVKAKTAYSTLEGAFCELACNVQLVHADPMTFTSASISPTSSTNRLSPVDKNDYPGIIFWTRADWDKWQTTSQGLKQKGKCRPAAFLEDKNGEAITEESLDIIRKTIRSLWFEFAVKGLLATSWSKTMHSTRTLFCSIMEEKHPLFRLVTDGWKLDLLCSTAYPSWHKNHLDADGNLLKQSKKVKQEDDNIDYRSNKSTGPLLPVNSNIPTSKPVLLEGSPSPINTSLPLADSDTSIPPPFKLPEAENENEAPLALVTMPPTFSCIVLTNPLAGLTRRPLTKSTTASLGPSDSVLKPVMAPPSITVDPTGTNITLSPCIPTTLPQSDVLAAAVSSKRAVKMRPGLKKNAWNLCAFCWLKQVNAAGSTNEFNVYYLKLNEVQISSYDTEAKQLISRDSNGFGHVQFSLGLRSDGSRVEGMHKGWNSLQHTQPSGIVMLSALSHDFVLHRNIRVTFSRRQMMPFVKFTHGSHHIQLSNHIAELYNGLCEKGTQLLPLLPELPDVNSGETFGLVASDNATTFGGFLIKEETLDAELVHDFEVHTDSFTGGTVDFATEASRSIMIEDWQIDPALLDKPAAQLPCTTNSSSTKPPTNSMMASNTNILAAKVAPPSLIKHKAICISPNSNNKSNSGSATTKRPQTLGPTSTKTLEGYFASGHLLTSHGEPPSTATGEAASEFSPLINDTHPKVHPFSPQINDTPQATSQFSPQINDTHTKVYPFSLSPQINNTHAKAGQTRSQCLFSIAMGIDPRSLTFQNSEEFYLFMNLWAEFKWVSYQMTSKRWVLVMEEYNRHLIEKMGQSVIQKNPQALLHALGDIEPKLMNRIIKDDKKQQRDILALSLFCCATCQGRVREKAPKSTDMLMLPNDHGYCADGIKQVSKSGEDLPPWPQPQGLFSEGRTFHPHAFLTAVQHVYERVFSQGPGEMDMLETEAFVKLLASCTEIHEDGAVLFRLFADFVVDSSTPCDHIITHDGNQWLQINFLQQL
ncbi:hypothetical protein EDB19DRAFT_1917696 [Suillus lakei]|nr:hypothetical protein EDB19DRAFT_1917696 [Suillus lakei]